MNLLEMILDAQKGEQVSQIAQKFGLSAGEAKNAIGQMVTPLSRGIQNNVSKGNGLNDLLGALSRGNQQRYLDDPQALESEDTVADGNNILGHILGSRDVSRNIAGLASKKTGLDAGVLKKMLPMVATLAMGALSRQSSGGRSLREQSAEGGQSPSAAGGFASFLDADKDGEIIDDLLNLGKRFF